MSLSPHEVGLLSGIWKADVCVLGIRDESLERNPMQDFHLQ